MNKIIHLFFILASFNGVCQKFNVEEFSMMNKDRNEIKSKIPRLKDIRNPGNPVVKKVNDKILEEFQIDSFDEKAEDLNYSDVRFTSEINSDILFIHYSGEYYGAYPSPAEADLLFDLASGNSIQNVVIPFQALFTADSYFDFMNSYWLPRIKDAFKEAVKCADNEQPSCSFYDIGEYTIESKKLSFSLAGESCYPHVLQACSPVYSVSIPLDAAATYLNPTLKKALIDDQFLNLKGVSKHLYDKKLAEQIPNNWFIFGKIDSKYAFSMALNFSADGKINGFYYYDSKKVKIKLEGSVNGENISLAEKFQDKVTGKFDMTLNGNFDSLAGAIYKPDSELRYLKGHWKTPNGDKVMAIAFSEIKINDAN